MRKFYSSALLRKIYTAAFSRRFVLSLTIVVFFKITTEAQIVQIGMGTQAPLTNNSIYSPICRFSANSGNDFSRSNLLYTAGELNAVGITTGATITKLGFYKIGTGATTAGFSFKIYMRNSATTAPLATTTTWANILSTHTLQYSNVAQTVGAATGWVEFILDVPFVYTGTNIEIAFDHDMSAISGDPTTGPFDWQYTDGFQDYVIGGVSTSAPATLNGTVVNYKVRPNIQITYISGGPCTSPPAAGAATANPSIPICTGTSVNLGLTGHSSGTGQTHVWQSSSSMAGTYADISASSPTSSFTVNPTTTTWYRAAVTCSGNTQYSTPVEVVVNPALPPGTYTVGSGGNYQTLAEVANALSCGIAGPVVFNFLPGSGPFTEQIIIPEIGGASATNTITFNGNGETIQATPVTATRHIIKLDGADHVTIKNFNIIAQSGATFGWGIHLTNEADHNTIDSCTIDISAVTSTTQSNSAGIVASGSTTSVTTAGSASYNVISNNTIIGAYQGIIITGTATSLNAVDNKITKNIVRDFYANGITLTNNDGAEVSYNNIHRAGRTAVTTFAGIELGANNKNCTVNANHIHDTHTAATTQTGTAYGVYSNACDAPAGSENRITNNLIYNFNSGSGTIYVLYNSGSDGVRYYHNTVVLDNPGSTAGVTRGFFQTTAAVNIDLKNNILYISRGGTGIKYCLYFGTTTSTITSNNNVLYNIAAAGTNGIGSFGTAGSTDLAAWQVANGGIYDQQSLSLDPLFASPSTGDYTPSSSLVDNSGVGVGVTTDIFGDTRNASTPDPGAYEFDLLVAGVNMGAESLVTPAASAAGCYTANETVTIRVRNGSTSSINFATSPVTITVNVTGAVTQTLTATLNTGTLASNTTMDVPMSLPLNMSTAGVYTFNAFTTVATDSDPSNDAMLPVDRTKETLNTGVIAVTPESLCVSQPNGPVLSTNGVNGYSSLQWQQSTTAGSGFTDIAGATTETYTIGTALTQNMYYRLIATCGSTTQTSSEVTVTFVNPQVLTTTPGTRCGPGAVTLSATGSAGTTLEWYEAATGGIALTTGNSFVTPTITNTTTYYVGAAIGGGGNINVGLPVVSSNPTSGSGTTNFGLVFDALSPFTLQAVTIYPISASGASGTVTIDVIDGTGAVVHTTTVNVTGSPIASPLPVTVALNFNILPGTNYKMRPGFTGISGLAFEPSAGAPPGGNYGYPFIVPGILSINTSTLTAAPANTARNDLYYYFYNWVVVTGCESIRTAITATVNTPPAFSVARDSVVCNNSITALSVESPLANFDSYTWSPVAGLFTDVAATIPYSGGSAGTLYIKTATAGAYKYYINANNSSTLCASIDSVTVTVLPGALSITSQPESLCTSGDATLSIPAGEYGNAIQWYTSTDGTNYTAIPGANSISYTTPTLSATTYYRLEIKNGAGAVCLQLTDTINYGAPSIVNATNGTRCGPGTVNLQATGSTGATVKWYDVDTGGLPIATGSSFTTPVLTATTTYYAAASSSSSSAPASMQIGTGTTQNIINSTTNLPPYGNWYSGNRHQILVLASELSNQGLSSGSVINSLAFDVVSNANALGYNGFTIKLGHTTASALSTTFLTSSTTQVYTTANFTPSIGWSTHSFSTPFVWDGTSNLLVETYFSNCGMATSSCTGGTTCTGAGSGVTYTQNAITNQSSTSFVSHVFYYSDAESCNPQTVATATSAVSVRPNMMFGVSVGCESVRTPVTATITAAPAFSITRDTLVCNNSITTLSVESPLANFDSYTWSPVTGLYTDAAATIPYTSGNATILYTKTASAGVYKYFITANNSSTLCAGLDSVSLTVLPASVTIQATRSGMCDPGTTTLSIPSGEYGNGLQWYSSDDGVIYLPIAGATSDTYNTPTLTATTYFKAEMKNGAGAVCMYDTIVISVGNPQVLSTTSATRCDAGSVTLQATASSLAELNWYESATGGSSVYTGPSFTTPVINSTTTYYVAAGSGFSLLSAGRVSPTGPTNLAASPRGIQFNATVPVKLVSVTVFSTAADAGSGTIELRNSAGTLIAGPVNVSWVGGGTTANPIPNVLTLNFDIPIGTGHRLLLATRTGGGIAYQTTGITGTWPTYSSAGGEIELTASMTSLTATSTSAYYFFFDWKVSTGCESPRMPVDAVINNTIIIDAGPANKTLCSDGQPVVFSVVANGAITNYQWRKNGVDIPGATSPIYTIANSSIADAGNYDVVVSGPCDTTTSNIAILTINAAAEITTDPVAQQVCSGGSVTFSASAIGAGSLGYQWRKDGNNIIGAYGSSFTINNISATDIGNYDVVVTGTCNQDTSGIAPLILSDATTITTNPLTQTVCTGTNVTFTAAGSGSGTLNYQWRKAGVNISGATSSSYIITGVTTLNAGIYDVVITGDCGSAISSVAGLTVNPGTVITSQPVAQSVCIGSNVTLSVTATGSGTLSYQWRKDGNNISGATSSSYTITGLAPADIAGYDVVITGSCGSVTSSSAALTISAAGSWIGVINSDWNNAANWCGGIPTSTTDVTISTVAPNMPVLSNAGSVRNIAIQTGASLTIAANGILNLYGNITGTGTFTPASGSIVFRGTNGQTVPAFTATNVTMNGAGGFTLNGTTTITGTLLLTNGNITLGSNDLILANTSAGSVASHIITNGGGSVIASGLTATSSPRTIPVAFNASTYNPVTLTPNPGHVTDNITVRIAEHVLTNGISGGQINEYVVDRTWLINESTTGGSNVNITLQWNGTEELNNFGRNESYVMQYSGGAWVPGVESPATGAGPYSQTKTNVTSLSAFALQTDPLPNAVTGIFPNPTNSILNVLIRTNAPEQVTISVYDESGKLVKTQAESVGYGGTLLQVDVSRFTAGTYILKVSIPGDREFLVRRFIKTN